MTAAAGDWFAVPRRGRVDEAVGALLAVRGAARARRRGMVVRCRRRRRGQGGISGQHEGLRRRQMAGGGRQGCRARGTGVVVKAEGQLAR